MDHAQRERSMRKHWKDNRTFQRSIENREGQQTYVFYEGPPTANGMPHAGHALGRTIKDFVARYKTMSGYQVLRKAGWDTHGLPVELEVEKQLNIRGKDDIEKFGVERFIEKCKESVFVYENEWKEFTDKLGYWVDMEDPYKTLNNPYIESVWNILATIHDEDLLYKGHRVVPYCPNCETSLSSHEVAQGYKDVTDLSVTAKFRIKGKDNEFILGWTTTPWTLPGNVALAVHPELTYVKVKQGDEIYYVAKSLANSVLGEEYEVIEEVAGEGLIGIHYEAPFNFISLDDGHYVIGADFVTDTSGTGIVHLNPAHGEDDYNAIQAKGMDFVNVVDSKGRYKDVIAPLAGQFVKDSDVDIIKMLAKDNTLYEKQKYEHSYPHCWRCDTPLLYYAMEGWFIKTTAVKEKMQENNQGVEWFPHHMRDGRFGNFLDNLVDWNIGRNRYWGTPLNVWVCDDCGKQKSPHSIKELRDFADNDVPEDIELHKPYVDKITFDCECGGKMHRTKEVIDVWFDSGSMPFAQYHHPFENDELFNKQFPADVVIEGVDQTRGWFYSLLAVSTLFTGKAPYKRVLSLGHILDEHGQKMSKSKGNALNPVELIEEFGADALRWALLADSSPWNNKRFSKKTVSQAKSKVIDTLLNVYSFYSMYADIDNFNVKEHAGDAKTTMDRWILSRMNSVIKEVTTSLDQYDITKGARSIALFVEELSNWYVRRSRQRFWSSGMNEDKKAAFTTLHEVLTKLTQLMAPYTPFVSDDIYTKLQGDSVHVSDFPKVDEKAIDEKLETDMQGVLEVIEGARSLRNEVNIKTKQPLAELVVVPNDQQLRTGLQSYTSIIEEEINVKQVSFKTDTIDFLDTEMKLNFPVAGPKLGKQVGQAKSKVENLSQDEKDTFIANGQITVELADGSSVTLEQEDILVEKKGQEGYQLFEGNRFVLLLDTNLTEKLKEEGFVREFIRAVQTYRKELNLPVEQRVDVYVNTDENAERILKDFDTLIHDGLIINGLQFAEKDDMKQVKVNDSDMGLFIS
ncbi:isoleucine--tRNA ligase [Oceanobacillus sp. 1P07AA]|uniref:isoleucine--tRNA ligase n=1 Tax=Oceanobacillus sp. 1P07AA TaxID=3132293 RepID=UPI0039A52FBC